MGAKFAIIFAILLNGVVYADSTAGATSRLLQSLQQKWVTPLWVKPKFGKDDPNTDGASGGSSNGNASSNSTDNMTSTAKSDADFTTDMAGKDKGSGSSKRLVMDDKAKKGTEGGVGNNGPPDPNRGGDVKTPPTMAGSGTIAFDKWYPVCIFIDPAEPNGNALVKEQVDIAAKCGVNLAVWTLTIQSDYSNDPNEINSRQQQSCNLGSILGVKQWSTQVAGKWPDSPARMCDAWKDLPGGGKTPDLGVAGCAQLCSNSGLGSGYMNGAGKGAYGAGMASGGAVPSIVKLGVGGGVGSHEDIGHSEMCMPNYDQLPGQMDLGLGIGTNPTGSARLDTILLELYADVGEKPPVWPAQETPIVSAAEEGSGLSGGYNGAGCAIFRQNAYQNDGTWRYDPSQKYYYAPEPDPKRQWHLGDPLFKPPGSPPPNPPPPFVYDPRGSPDDKQLVMDDQIKLGIDANPKSETEDPKHKRVRNSDASARDALVESIQDKLKSQSTIPDPIDKNGKSGGSSDVGNNDATSLTFDDSVKKDAPPDDSSGSKVGSGSSSSSSSSSASGGGGSDGGGSQLVFDDNAPKGSEGSGGSSNGEQDGADRSPASMDMSGGAAQGLADGMNSALAGDKLMLQTAGALPDSEMSSDFFSNKDEKETKKNGRVRGSGLRRGSSQKAPGE